MISSASAKTAVSDGDVERFLSQRASEKRIKRLLERVQESVKAYEQEIIAKLDRGADVNTGNFGLRIRVSNRRFPAWKEHFISVAGKEAADQILERTEPKVHRNLIVEIASGDSEAV